MNHYATAINILMEISGSDLSKIAIEIAKSHPALFNKHAIDLAAKKVIKPTAGITELPLTIKVYEDESWFRPVCYELSKGRKIQAVMKYRNYTGAGLKESEYFIDDFYEDCKKFNVFSFLCYGD